MLRKTSIPIALVLSGSILGYGSSELVHYSNDKHSKQTFDRKLRCKILADEYTSDGSKGNTGVMTLDNVGYSAADNTCLASVVVYDFIGSISQKRYEVVDLVSGKETYVGSCGTGADCSSGKDIKLENQLDLEFHRAIAGDHSPVTQKR